MHEERSLWDPEVQARPQSLVWERAGEQLDQAWERVWDLPVPFYRDKYEAAGLGPGERPPLEEIPRTTKAELRADEAANPPWGTHRAVTLAGAVRIGVSGGTTGSPTMFFYGRTDLDVHIAVVTRNLWRHGLRPGMRFTHSWPQGLYPSALGGGRSYLELGVLEVPVGLPMNADAAAEHVRLWQLLRPDGFMMTGSQLDLYTDAAGRLGLDIRDLLGGGRLTFLEASCQFEGPRGRVEDAYGVRVRNIGGTSDVPGFAVSDCSYHTGLHVAGDHFAIQVCDPHTGREVPDGVRGTLVITAFGIDAVAIRYDVEDVVVRSHGVCPCGETGPRYTLLGRAADAVTVSGTAILPVDLQLALDDVGAPEFAMSHATDGEGLSVRVETTRSASLMANLLTARLGVPVHVDTVLSGTLPRAMFKPRRTATP